MMVARELPKEERRRTPLFCRRDAYFLAYLPAMAAVAWLLP